MSDNHNYYSAARSPQYPSKRRMNEVAIVEDAKAASRTREMDAVPRRKMRLLPVLLG